MCVDGIVPGRCRCWLQDGGDGWAEGDSTIIVLLFGLAYSALSRCYVNLFICFKLSASELTV